MMSADAAKGDVFRADEWGVAGGFRDCSANEIQGGDRRGGKADAVGDGQQTVGDVEGADSAVGSGAERIGPDNSAI